MLLSLMALLACTPTDTDADGIADASDCAPEDPSIFPGAPETCDGVDNNCDGEIDEGATFTAYTDADGDGWGDLDSAAAVCTLAEDQVEIAGDCDDADSSLTPDTQWFLDADGDGHGDPDAQIASCDPQSGLVDNSTDCDDLNASVSPEGSEVCDGVDNDCNGEVDDSAADSPTWYTDADGDGYGVDSVSACEAPTGTATVSGDCDDTDPAISPGAVEVCDAVDNDCDGVADFDGWIPADYPSLADALAAEIEDGHFCLSEGTHAAGDLESNTSTTLEGAGSDRVLLDAEGSSFIDAAKDLSLHGLTIQNVSSTDDPYPTIYMEYGDLSLQDVRIEEVYAAYTYGNSTAAIHCNDPCSMVLEDVEITAVTFVQPEDYTYATTGQLIDGWGGDLVVEGLEIHEIYAEGNYFYGMVDFWGASVAIETMSIHDTDIRLTRDDHYTYSRGMLGLYGATSATIDGLELYNNSTDFNETSALSNQHWMGEVIGYVEPAQLRNIKVVDNTLEGSQIANIENLVFNDWTGQAVLENVIIAGNQVSGSVDTFNGLLGGFSSLSNADISGNDFGTAATSNGLFVPVYEATVRNTNVVNNTLFSEESTAQLATLEDPEQGFTWTASNRYGNTFSGEVSVLTAEGREGFVEVYSFDPLYTDTSGESALSWDLSLQSASPAIDAGEGEDADGSTADLGALGGTGASW